MKASGGGFLSVIKPFERKVGNALVFFAARLVERKLEVLGSFN